MRCCVVCTFVSIRDCAAAAAAATMRRLSRSQTAAMGASLNGDGVLRFLADKRARTENSHETKEL
jgi:hypothetical protein